MENAEAMNDLQKAVLPVILKFTDRMTPADAIIVLGGVSALIGYTTDSSASGVEAAAKALALGFQWALQQMELKSADGRPSGDVYDDAMVAEGLTLTEPTIKATLMITQGMAQVLCQLPPVDGANHLLAAALAFGAAFIENCEHLSVDPLHLLRMIQPSSPMEH